jgi:hypothetical protein
MGNVPANAPPERSRATTSSHGRAATTASGSQTHNAPIARVWRANALASARPVRPPAKVSRIRATATRMVNGLAVQHARTVYAWKGDASECALLERAPARGRRGSSAVQRGNGDLEPRVQTKHARMGHAPGNARPERRSAERVTHRCSVAARARGRPRGPATSCAAARVSAPASAFRRQRRRVRETRLCPATQGASSLPSRCAPAGVAQTRLPAQSAAACGTLTAA